MLLLSNVSCVSFSLLKNNNYLYSIHLFKFAVFCVQSRVLIIHKKMFKKKLKSRLNLTIYEEYIIKKLFKMCKGNRVNHSYSASPSCVSLQYHMRSFELSFDRDHATVNNDRRVHNICTHFRVPFSWKI